MRLFLTTIVLVLLAQPALAKTVYYCSPVKAIALLHDTIKEVPVDRFTMSVNSKTVEFQGGSLAGSSLKIEFLDEDDNFRAKDTFIGDHGIETSALAAKTGKFFVFTSVFKETAHVVSLFATCETF